jgi:hypothetical protein
MAHRGEKTAKNVREKAKLRKKVSFVARVTSRSRALKPNFSPTAKFVITDDAEGKKSETKNGKNIW